MLFNFIIYIVFVVADIYEEECDKLHKLGLNCQCLGGGRIKHDSGSKKILVYGYSQVSCEKISSFNNKIKLLIC